MAGRIFTSNWHTHTFRCGHAAGDAADYCAAAIPLGLTTLGFSDHMPLPAGVEAPAPMWQGVRMPFEALRGYRDAIAAAKRDFAGRLNVFAGIEAEWYAGFGESYYRDVFLGEYGLEFLAGAPHYFQFDDGAWGQPWFRVSLSEQTRYCLCYARHVVKMIETGLFAFIAHPDLLGACCDCWTPDSEAASRDIAQAAHDAGVPLEINTSGFRKNWLPDANGVLRQQYPWEPFWRVAAEEGCVALVGTDAHAPEFLCTRVRDAYILARRVGVTVTTFAGAANGRLIPAAT